MPSNKRRIGIIGIGIGIGFGTAVHGPSFQSEAWNVPALCSRNRKKLRKAADAAGVADIHTDPREMIRRGDLDAIAINTPPSAHYTLLQAASCVSTMPLVVVIDPRLLIKSMAGLINYAEDTPGRLSSGNTGEGSSQQLAMRLTACSEFDKSNRRDVV
jgi:hypothetical protein